MQQIGVFARRTETGEFLPVEPIMAELDDSEKAAVDDINEQLAEIFVDFLKPYMAELKKRERRRVNERQNFYKRF